MNKWRNCCYYQLLIEVLVLLILPSLTEMSEKNYIFKKISEPLDVGTRIFWDEKSHSIYFVDVTEFYLYKYDTKTNVTSQVKVADEPLAFAFPVTGTTGKFIAGIARKFVTFDWDGSDSKVKNLCVVAEVDTEEMLKENRLNGAKIDPFGRLWAGTMVPEGIDGKLPGKGSLYMLDAGKLTKQESDIRVSNGLAWDLKKNKMYYVDTANPEVYMYDFDQESGRLSNKKVIFDIRKNNLTGFPDGMAIDNNGHVWVTLIFGSAIIQIDPESGRMLQNIKTPVSQPTSITFGNDDLSALYITTAKIVRQGVTPEYPAGSTYVVENIGNTGPLDTGYKMS